MTTYLRDKLSEWLAARREQADAAAAHQKTIRRLAQANEAEGRLAKDLAKHAGVGRNAPERHVEVDGVIVRLKHLEREPGVALDVIAVDRGVGNEP